MKKKNYDYLVVGTGLFGSVFAQQMHENGRRCLLIDKRAQKGGNIYCEERNGIRIHSYGPHIFHTDNEDVWQYINRFATFNHYINSPLVYYKGELYNLPFNMNTFNKLWKVNTPAQAKEKIGEQIKKYKHITKPANLEEQALKLCGEDIYYTFIKEYTEKQWGKKATELPAFIINRIPLRFVYDNNYFNDPYQGVPTKGYNSLINSLLENIEVKTNTDYFTDRDYFNQLAHKIVFTGCIDSFFNHEFGQLEYRSLRFEHEQLDINDFQGNAIVNYNEKSIPYTRIIEHKHFEFGSQSSTIITREYPQPHHANNEPFYPINDTPNMQRYQLYAEKAKSLKNVLWGGRLGQYAYYDMDDTIAAALNLAKNEILQL